MMKQKIEKMLLMEEELLKFNLDQKAENGW